MARATFERLEERRFLSVGGLDGSFGVGGKVVTDFSGGNDQGRQIVVAQDGKIVVIGNTIAAGSSTSLNFGIARYNSDGSLDSSFGNGGKVITDFGSSFDFGLAVQLQGDGKVLAAGVGGSRTTFVMARYNTDGSLDSSFGSGGKVVTTIASTPIVSLGLQSNKIILGGTTGGNFVVARYNADGSTDTSFGPATTPGRIVTDLGGTDIMNSLVVQSDGRIVAAGFSNLGTRNNLGFVRYASDGKSLDTTFHGNGILITDFGTLKNSAQAVTLQPDGKIVAAGVSYTVGGSDENTALLRLNPDGTFDNTFHGDGKVITDFGGADSAMSVVIQSNGKIIAGGNGGGGFAISRYNTDGSLDSSFGNGGKVTTTFTGGAAEFSVALQPDGKLLAAGQVGSSPNQNFGLARYITNSNPVAAAISVSLNEDQSISAAVNATDADNDSLSFSLASSPENGTVQFNADGTFTYTPRANFNGQDSFTFSVSDGSTTDSATVTITVLPVNDAPLAADAAFSVSEDGLVDVSLTASDVETSADQLVFTIASLPQYGVLSHDGAAVQVGDTFTGSPTDLTYEPGAASDDATADSFTFTVTDTGDGESPALTSNIGNVAITIDRAASGSVALGEDGVLRIAGTEGDDSISLSANGGYLNVLFNGETVSNNSIQLSDVSEIHVWGRAGNDQIDLSGLSISSFIHGGAGDDVLTGGAGDDLILGGGGSDHLTGAAGNDFLIGGDGSDRIVGSSGHDVLTAGDISSQFTIRALQATSAAWAADKTVSEDDQSMADDSVVDENEDQLTGASGADWFIISAGDKITDLAKAISKDGDVITYVS